MRTLFINTSPSRARSRHIWRLGIALATNVAALAGAASVVVAPSQALASTAHTSTHRLDQRGVHALRTYSLSASKPVGASWPHPEPLAALGGASHKPAGWLSRSLRPGPYRTAAAPGGSNRQGSFVHAGTIPLNYESTNWSGYVDSGNGAQFNDVTASWKVPSASPGVTGSSSTWVGIDGTTTSDLIQAGTEQDWTASGPVYYAWYELLPDPASELIGPSGSTVVSAGDQMSVTINNQQGNTWQISVTDETQGVSWSGPVNYSVPGNSAEWVAEAPTDASSGALEPLADFGSVTFSSMGAGGAGTANAQATPVYMVDSANQAVKAYPSPYDAATDAFQDTYGSPSPMPTNFPAVTIAPISAGSSTTSTPGTTSAIAPAPTSSPTTIPTSTTAPPGPVPTTTTEPSGPFPSTTVPGSTPANSDSRHGYWLASADGAIYAFGSAPFYGPGRSLHLQRPLVGLAPTPDHRGYWTVASDGGVFAFGDANYEGSVPALGIGPFTSKRRHHLSAPIVGMTSSTDGRGYLMVAGDGGVFAFGDAHFYGSCGSKHHCSAGVTAIVPTPQGNGYWLLLSDCQMVPFGGAPHIASTSCSSYTTASDLKAVAAVATPDGLGYWTLVSDGSIYAQGDASSLLPSQGARATDPLSDPAVAIIAAADGAGTWTALAGGAVKSEGNAPSLGEVDKAKLSTPIVAAAGW